MSTFSLNYIFNIIFPVPLILIGLFGNVSIILTYTRAKFCKMQNRHVWRLLAVNDTLCLVQIFKFFIKNQFHIYLEGTSNFLCKFISYLTHFSIISAHLLVYISIDRMLAILFPHINKSLKQHQAIILLSILALNITFYSQRLVYQDLFMPTNKTNHSIATCAISDSYKSTFKVFEWLELVFGSIIPFSIMLLCSIFLIISIGQSRRRIRMPRCSKKARRRISRDIKFAITLITVNFLFIYTNLPIQIFFIVTKEDLWSDAEWTWFYILDSLYYSGFIANFYVYLLVNTEFRKQFFCMTGIHWLFGKKEKYITTKTTVGYNNYSQ